MQILFKKQIIFEDLMDRIEVGKTVTYLRGKKRISQINLSKKIGVSQSVISSIEYGTSTINENYIEALLKIAGFFEIDFADLIHFEEIKVRRQLEAEENEWITKAAIYSENYDFFGMQEMVKKNITYDSPIIRTILLRFEAIVLGWLNKQPQEAIELLEIESVVFTEDSRRNYQNILFLNTLASLYFVNKQYEDARRKYEQLLTYYLKLDFKESDRFYLRLHYNLSLVYRELGDNDSALEVINKGINLNRKYLSMFSLNDLYYQKAIIYSTLKNLRESKKALKKAKFLSDFLRNKESYIYETTLELALEMNERGIWEHNGIPLCLLKKNEIEQLYVELPLIDKKKRGRPRKS